MDIVGIVAVAILLVWTVPLAYMRWLDHVELTWNKHVDLLDVPPPLVMQGDDPPTDYDG